jgi:hypothetical protein
MACSHPCIKRQTLVVMKGEKVTPSADNDKDCDRDNKKTLKKLIATAKKNIEKELEEVTWITECTSDKEGEECGCSGLWGKYGDPVPGTRNKEIVIGECKWDVEFSYEIKARVYTGTCVPTKGKSKTAMGAIPVGPDDSDFVVIDWPGKLDADTVNRLEGILKDSARDCN